MSTVKRALSGLLALTGKTQTIQALRTLARRDRVTYVTQKNKAYWAPGKRGLD